ncbi:putative pre-mrna splicing factor protein [Erysiphe neolycopersici]|uniref:Putative pre-mrna splicing factor protein n=1 Tax=Erysiphe neolycopersici TaxID=212602 RepID=A0A420I675_9PEZI|nr:putative pre-mrna splicing factor protein [Erysiphe neolycopersici]
MKLQNQRTSFASKRVSSTKKKRRAPLDRNISHMIKLNIEISTQARKHSENHGVNFRKLALTGTYSRYRQFTVNRIFKLSCRSNNPKNQVTLVKTERVKAPTKRERLIRLKLPQKDMPNMSQCAKELLVKSDFKISPNSMFDPKVSIAPKRKRISGPWSYRKINDFHITEMNSIRTSTHDSALRDIKTLRSLFRFRKLKINVKRLPLAIDQEFTSGQIFLDHCPHSMRYTSSLNIKRDLNSKSRWNSPELITPKHLVSKSKDFALLPRVILWSLPAKLSLLIIFKALRCLVSLSPMEIKLESMECIENNLSPTKPLALLKILDSVTSYEKSDLIVVFKKLISILEVRLKDSMNHSKELGYFINDYCVDSNLNMYNGSTKVLCFLKKWHHPLITSKDHPALSLIGALKGHDTSLYRIFIADKTSKLICVDKLVSPIDHIQFAFETHTNSLSNNDNNDDDGGSSINRYIDKEKEKAERKSKVKKQVNRAPAKSPYFFSSKKYYKEKALNSPMNLCCRYLSFSSHFKIPDVVPTLSGEMSRKHSVSGTISCIPFPPLSESYFGLIQEKLADNPFCLLIAITFLIRTHGKQAIPIYHKLISRYPTPESFVAADMQEMESMITCLGFQNQRANTCKLYASTWLQDPPIKDKRYAVRDYPVRGSGRNIRKGEVLTDSDTRDAWEIGHMTSGPYALDSWRIFCRDKLRRVAAGWNGERACEGFQPEWMRVVPQDKELRAFLQWMWLKEGFLWNPQTGDKEVAGTELMIDAMEGRIL